MAINFNEVAKVKMPGMNNGTGEITAKILMAIMKKYVVWVAERMKH